jgi:hypothetical protein
MRYLMSHDRRRYCWIIYDSEIDADKEDNTVAIAYTRQAAKEKRRLLNRIDREEVLSQPCWNCGLLFNSLDAYKIGEKEIAFVCRLCVKMIVERHLLQEKSRRDVVQGGTDQDTDGCGGPTSQG